MSKHVSYETNILSKYNFKFSFQARSMLVLSYHILWCQQARIAKIFRGCFNFILKYHLNEIERFTHTLRCSNHVHNNDMKYYIFFDIRIIPNSLY